jgi:hypothetical protein
MMEDLLDIMTGKVISIWGPTLGGKTRLVTQLIQEIPSLHIINFESIISFKKTSKENYKTLYSKIDEIKGDGISLITESVKQLDYPSDLFILCMPSFAQHLANYKNFQKRFGYKNTDFRTAGARIGDMRKVSINNKKDLLVYSDDNGFKNLVLKINEVLCY